MIPVIIESPFAGATEEIRQRNKEYLKAAVLDCLSRGESPYASHVFFTQFLNDDDKDERALGIKAGFAWYSHAEKICVYTDLGISKGMQQGINHASERYIQIIHRSLEAWKS